MLLSPFDSYMFLDLKEVVLHLADLNFWIKKLRKMPPLLQEI